MQATRITSGVYRRTDGLYGWRIVADNGQIVATDGTQGYERREFAEHMYAQFTYTPPDAD